MVKQYVLAVGWYAVSNSGNEFAEYSYCLAFTDAQFIWTCFDIFEDWIITAQWIVHVNRYCNVCTNQMHTAYTVLNC